MYSIMSDVIQVKNSNLQTDWIPLFHMGISPSQGAAAAAPYNC